MRKPWIGPIVGIALLGTIAVVLGLATASNRTIPEGTRAPVIVDVYDPVRAGEPIPPDFRQLLHRDSIRPIYDPVFVTAGESNWTETTIVIGVEVNGDARAYSVAHLGRREMVNDTIGGEPLLVTW